MDKPKRFPPPYKLEKSEAFEQQYRLALKNVWTSMMPFLEESLAQQRQSPPTSQQSLKREFETRVVAAKQSALMEAGKKPKLFSDPVDLVPFKPDSGKE